MGRSSLIYIFKTSFFVLSIFNIENIILIVFYSPLSMYGMLEGLLTRGIDISKATKCSTTKMITSRTF